MRWVVAVAVLLALLTGCGGPPAPAENPTPVPAQRFPGKKGADKGQTRPAP